MLRAVLALAAFNSSIAAALRAAGIHRCVAMMRETQYACKGNAFGKSDDDCHYAMCYTADLGRKSCEDIVTDSTPGTKFGEQLDDLLEHHGVDCDDGGMNGEGQRNARFDCGSVPADGLSEGSFLESFARRYPASAEVSGLKKCFATPH